MGFSQQGVLARCMGFKFQKLLPSDHHAFSASLAARPGGSRMPAPAGCPIARCFCAQSPLGRLRPCIHWASHAPTRGASPACILPGHVVSVKAPQKDSTAAEAGAAHVTPPATDPRARERARAGPPPGALFRESVFSVRRVEKGPIALATVVDRLGHLVEPKHRG